jgi:hypothetical protein
MAANGGYGNVVTKLIEAKADVDAAGQSYGETALHMAADKGYGKVVTKLIEAKANVHAVHQEYGETALHLAAKNDRGDVVTKLIEAGANVDAKDDSGETALSKAASYGYSEVVAELIAACADKHAADNEGQTPLDRAAAIPIPHGDAVIAILNSTNTCSPISEPTPGPTTNPSPGPTTNPTSSPTLGPVSVAAAAFDEVVDYFAKVGPDHCYTSTSAAKLDIKKLKSKFESYRMDHLKIDRTALARVDKKELIDRFKGRQKAFAATKRDLRTKKRAARLGGKSCRMD